jgi:hypothetical protein
MRGRRIGWRCRAQIGCGRAVVADWARRCWRQIVCSERGVPTAPRGTRPAAAQRGTPGAMSGAGRVRRRRDSRLGGMRRAARGSPRCCPKRGDVGRALLCHLYVMPMSCLCHVYVIPMSCLCHAYVMPMSERRGRRRGRGRAGEARPALACGAGACGRERRARRGHAARARAGERGAPGASVRRGRGQAKEARHARACGAGAGGREWRARFGRAARARAGERGAPGAGVRSRRSRAGGR